MDAIIITLDEIIKVTWVTYKVVLFFLMETLNLIGIEFENKVKQMFYVDNLCPAIQIRHSILVLVLVRVLMRERLAPCLAWHGLFGRCV